MHRGIRNAAAALLAVALTAPGAATLAAGPSGDRKAPVRLARLEGWIVTSEMGRKHANAESAAAVVESYERGYPLVFIADGKDEEIPLADQEAALLRVGRRVAAIGHRDAEGVLHVGTWRDAPERPQPAGEEPGS